MENDKCVICKGERVDDFYNEYCKGCYLKNIEVILEEKYRLKNERENNE